MIDSNTHYYWMFDTDILDEKFKEITKSVKARKNISNADYLALLRHRVEQLEITRIVLRLNYQHELFRKMFGLTTLHDSPNDLANQRDFADGGEAAAIIESLEAVILGVEKGLSRKDLMKEMSQDLLVLEQKVDEILYMDSPMKNLATIHFNAHSLADFQYLKQTVAKGYFAPTYAKGGEFGVWWYGPRDAWNEWAQRMGVPDENGKKVNLFQFCGEDGLTKEQMWSIQDLTDQKRKHAQELRDQGKPRPHPWR